MQVHAEQEAEQAYLDEAYRCLDQGHALAERHVAQHQAGDLAAHRAMRRALAILKDAKGQGQLIHGRLDRPGEDPLYVGRRVVFDEDRDVLVVGWHAPAAEAFYAATPDEPGTAQLKRTFVEEERRLVRLIDEIVRGGAGAATAVPSGDAVVSDALLAELDRSRDGAMRDVVATIQAEQYRIIRAPRDGVLVVQGGPGTGKTVIGLHRAAWLALNDEELRRQGLLIVSPNAALLSYTSGVLPTLGVADLYQTDVAGLYLGEAAERGVDEPLAARVKGSERMAEVLRRALAARIGWTGQDLVLSVGPMRVVVPRAEVEALLDDVRRRRLSHADGRVMVRERLSALAFAAYQRYSSDAGRLVAVNEVAIRRLAAFTNAVDRMWPTFTPEEFLRTLFGTQSLLVAAAEGVLTAEERASLFRPPTASIGEEPWTAADLFCLDELAGMFDGDDTRYAHVVVDEAQDLTPMQARALARRCPSGSFTVLGDLAQATGSFIRDRWEELTRHLGGAAAPVEASVETLRFCYRVPGSALDLAARQLPLISPDLRAPTAVRPGRLEPVATWAEEGELLEQALLAARTAVEAGATTGLLVPDALYDELMDVAARSGGGVGDGRSGDFSADLSAVPVTLSKGLEFDAVVVAAPERVVADHEHGRRLLYIALTRCTQELRLVHSGDLPEGLQHLDLRARDVVPEAGPIATTEEAPEGPVVVPADDLVALVGRLSDEDRQLVHDLVLRLLRNAPGPGAQAAVSGEEA